ncbi:MAG TPA: glycosyltransferase [Gaiellaceae bacterium]|nr:glycosyltransferase [Gaiellaceae bacterium]
MRIVVVTHQFFPRYYSGVERITLNLATQFARMGHECTVMTSAAHSSGDSRPFVHEGVRVVPLDLSRADVVRPWAQPHRRAEAVGRAIAAEQPDIVHILHAMRLPEAFSEAESAGVPIVAHVPDLFYPCARGTMIRRDRSLCASAEGGTACASACWIKPGRERLRWAQQTLDRAGAVVCPSRATIEVHRENGFDTSHWQHIPWGVDYAIHGPRTRRSRTGPLVVGFLGTLLEHKGSRVAVEALRAAPDLDVELRLYGGSFHEVRYERELRRLATADPRVSFRGAYEHAELRSVLAELDAVVIPSLWRENLPTTGLNAVAAGVPLLVSDVGGLVELLEDYRCGFSFAVGDGDALASLLSRFVEEPELLDKVRDGMRYPPGIEDEAWRLLQLYEALR